MISALAPGYTVVTITVGDSVTGYSRVPRKVYPTIPKRISSTDITPAKTGRDILTCEMALMNLKNWLVEKMDREIRLF